MTTPTPKQLHRLGVLDRDVHCYFARFSERPCAGPIQAAHWLSVSFLKSQTPMMIAMGDAVIADPRNGVPACAFHHGQFDNRFLRVPRSAVPGHVEHFAADLGLTWRLDRDHPTTESESR